MIRTISVVSAFLLATSSIVHAEGRESSLVNLEFKPYQWGFKNQHLQRVDTNMSPPEDRASSLVDFGFKPYRWGFKKRYLHGIDMNMSPREYEEINGRNRRFVSNTLMFYSKDALESIGMPEQGINLMGMALGSVINGPRLDLNKSKTLALEFNDVGNPGRTLYFGANLDW